MVGAASPERVDLVVTVSPVLQAVVGAVLLLWIILLTTLVLRRCREPWRDDGWPVYQRLPDGRIRFSWGVAGQLAGLQRRTMAGHDDLDTHPIGLRVSAVGPAVRNGSGRTS